MTNNSKLTYIQSTNSKKLDKTKREHQCFTLAQYYSKKGITAFLDLGYF